MSRLVVICFSLLASIICAYYLTSNAKMDANSIQQPEEDSAKLKRLKKVRHQLMILPVSAIIFVIGAYISWSPTSLYYLRDIYISKNIQQTSWVGSLLPLGAVLGTLPVGVLADKYGRKFTVWFTTLPLMISSFIICLMDHMTAIYIARFFAGIGCGAASVIVPIYFYEIADDYNQQNIERVIHIIFNFGILFPYIVRMTKSIIILPVLALFITILILLLPESPKWLEARGKKEEAEKAIKRLTYEDIQLDPTQPAISIDNSGLRLATFRSITNKKDVFLILGLITLQQLSGMPVFIFYSTDYITFTSGMQPFAGLAYIMVTPIISAYFFPKFLKSGRELYLLAINMCSMVIFPFLLAGYMFLGYPMLGTTYFPFVIVLLLACLFTFNIGLCPIPWIMIGKMFPSSTRKFVYNLALTCGWATMFIATKTFYDLLSYMGIYTVLCICGFINIIGIIFINYSIPSTIEQVDDNVDV